MRTTEAVVVVGGTGASARRSPGTTPAAGARRVLGGSDRRPSPRAVARGRRGHDRERARPRRADDDRGGARRHRACPTGSALAAIDRDQNRVARLRHRQGASASSRSSSSATPPSSAPFSERRPPDASLVLFGGWPRSGPCPGSTTVTTVNGGVVGLTRTLVEELRRRSASTRSTRGHRRQPVLAGSRRGPSKYASKPPSPRAGHDGRDRRRERCSCSRTPPSNGAIDLIVDGGWHCHSLRPDRRQARPTRIIRTDGPEHDSKDASGWPRLKNSRNGKLDHPEIGNALREARRVRGLSPARAGEPGGVLTKPDLRSWRQGHANPSVSALYTIDRGAGHLPRRAVVRPAPTGQTVPPPAQAAHRQHGRCDTPGLRIGGGPPPHPACGPACSGNGSPRCPSRSRVPPRHL